jgi:hypothetical protein
MTNPNAERMPAAKARMVAEIEYLTGLPFPPVDATSTAFREWEIRACVALARRWFVDRAIADRYTEICYLSDPNTYDDWLPIVEAVLGRKSDLAKPEAAPKISPSRQMLAEFESRMLNHLTQSVLKH